MTTTTISSGHHITSVHFTISLNFCFTTTSSTLIKLLFLFLNFLNYPYVLKDSTPYIRIIVHSWDIRYTLKSLSPLRVPDCSNPLPNLSLHLTKSVIFYSPKSKTPLFSLNFFFSFVFRHCSVPSLY